MIKRGCKQAQISLSFTFIFSVILIAVFLVAAIIGIRYFLEWQKETKTGLFLLELQEKVDEVWKSEYAETDFKIDLPSNIKNVCFVNFSISRQGYEEILKDFEKYKARDANLFFYPTKALGYPLSPHYKINHIYFEKNPLCFKNKEKIKIVKEFDEALVRLEAES